MIELKVELGNRSYPITIGKGALDLLGEVVSRLDATKVLIVTNTTVGPLYAQQAVDSIRSQLPDLKVHVLELPDGECYKDLEHIEKILMSAAECGLDRKSLMVALGGGVVGDMTGFAASIWMRGIEFVQVPTTLLAQVDSSVGGKTGVNFPAGKNLIGAFHQPKAVLIDSTVLQTLPSREVSAGIAEIIKYGLLGDAQFVEALELCMNNLKTLDSQVLSDVVGHCCQMKAQIVRQDEREQGQRAKLNLGHTFGHAIEKVTGFKTWLHGEAVGVGLIMAAMLSEELGYLSSKDVDRVKNLVTSAGLPVHIDGVSSSLAYQAMIGDKKSIGGVVRFVVLKAIGSSEIQTVDQALLQRVMNRMGWA